MALDELFHDGVGSMGWVYTYSTIRNGVLCTKLGGGERSEVVKKRNKRKRVANKSLLFV